MHDYLENAHNSTQDDIYQYTLFEFAAKHSWLRPPVRDRVSNRLRYFKKFKVKLGENSNYLYKKKICRKINIILNIFPIKDNFKNFVLKSKKQTFYK